MHDTPTIFCVDACLCAGACTLEPFVAAVSLLLFYLLKKFIAVSLLVFFLNSFVFIFLADSLLQGRLFCFSLFF
ncbi:hypothetical protein TCDM_10356 [Trypanosoma cruzi Dm28c]|uniref:Uncharacterized protein n=1 Tax=Trypanosoma cruzi Dm28c TaxID=1416333 RepID=V5BC73_TRYCR|nr:hypothetical protein TCDM_10356 [Trypanosoma cruzi Dm28c]